MPLYEARYNRKMKKERGVAKRKVSGGLGRNQSGQTHISDSVNRFYLEGPSQKDADVGLMKKVSDAVVQAPQENQRSKA